MSRIPDSSDVGVVMDISNRESSSGSRSSAGIGDDARTGGRYLAAPDGTSTAMDLDDPLHPAICGSESFLLSLLLCAADVERLELRQTDHAP